MDTRAGLHFAFRERSRGRSREGVAFPCIRHGQKDFGHAAAACALCLLAKLCHDYGMT